jgi:hypothetical protein
MRRIGTKPIIKPVVLIIKDTDVRDKQKASLKKEKNKDTEYCK